MAKVLPSGQGRAASAPIPFALGGDSMAVLNAAAEDRRTLQRQSVAVTSTRPAAVPARAAGAHAAPIVPGQNLPYSNKCSNHYTFIFIALLLILIGIQLITNDSSNHQPLLPQGSMFSLSCTAVGPSRFLNG